MVTNLILLNLLVFLVDQFTPGVRGANWLSNLFALRVSLLAHPWEAWRLISYGFTHDPQFIGHVGWNMFGLWLFGREVESKYGRHEFLRMYMAGMVFGGLCWVLLTFASAGYGWSAYAQNKAPEFRLIGASAAVMTVVLIYAINFPYRTFLMFFVLPVPAWLLAALYVLSNIVGARREMLGSGDGTAYTAHLGGALYAAMYYYGYGWRWWPDFTWVHGKWTQLTRWASRSRGPRPSLKIHKPAEEPADFSADDSGDELVLDRLLEKIHQSGESSLTPQERQTLEAVSRRYQKRRR